MRAVYSIKIAHADQRRAEAGGNVLEFAEDLHRKAALDLRPQLPKLNTGRDRSIWLRSDVRGPTPSSDLKLQFHPVMR